MRALSDGQLVAPEIQGADGDRQVLHPFQDGAVCAVVLLLGRKLFPVQVEELGPVEPDTLPAMGEDARHLLRELDVREQVHAASVERLRRQIAIFEQRGLAGPGRGARRLETLHFLRVGRDEHLAGAAVQRDQVSGPGNLARLSGSHDARHLQSAREDGGVRGLAAEIGDEPLDPP